MEHLTQTFRQIVIFYHSFLMLLLFGKNNTPITLIQAETTANSSSESFFENFLYYIGSILHTETRVDQICYSFLYIPLVTSENNLNRT